MPSIRACASSAWRLRTDRALATLNFNCFAAVVPARRMGPIEHLRLEHAALTAVRRDLHAHPELGFEEHRTVEVVTRELAALGVEYHAGIGKTGVGAVIPGERT